MPIPNISDQLKAFGQPTQSQNIDSGSVVSAKSEKLGAKSQGKKQKLAPVMLPNTLAEFAADKPNITLAEIAQYETDYAAQQQSIADADAFARRNQLVDSTDNVMGAMANFGVQLGTGVARTATQIAAAPFEAASFVAQGQTTDKQRKLYEKVESKKNRIGGIEGSPLTAEEAALYERNEPSTSNSILGAPINMDTPNADGTSTKVNIGNDVSTAGKLGFIDSVKENITNPKEVSSKFMQSLQNQDDRDQLNEELGGTFDDAMTDFDKGDYGTFATKLVANGVGNLISNPLATVGYLAESLPQMMATAARTPANVGYAITTATTGTAEFVEAEGRQPTRKELLQILAVSASAAAAEQFSASKILPKKAKETAKKVAESAITETTRKVVKSAAGEAATEGYQTAAEQVAGTLDVDKIDGKEVFIGAAAGLGSASVITGATSAKDVVKDVSKTLAAVKTKAAKKFAEGQARVKTSKAVQEAVLTGDMSKLDTSTDRADFLMNPESVPKDEKGMQAHVDEINLHVKKVMDDVSKMEAGPEKTAAITKAVALNEREQAIRNLAAPTVAQINAEIESVTEATEKDEATDASIERVFNSMSTAPGKVSVEQAQTLADSDVVTPKQKKQLEQYIVLENAKNELDVNSDVLNGGDGFIGITQYQNAINSANKRGDKAAAKEATTGLISFANIHAAKAQAVNAAYEAALYGEDNAQVLAKEVKAAYDLVIHKGSNSAKHPLVTILNDEAKALNAAVTQLTGTDFVAAPAPQVKEAPLETPTPKVVQTSSIKPEKVTVASEGIARIKQYTDAINAAQGKDAIADVLQAKIDKLTDQSAPKNVQWALDKVQTIAQYANVAAPEVAAIETANVADLDIETVVNTNEDLIQDTEVTSESVNHELHQQGAQLRSQKHGLRPVYDTAANVVAKGVDGVMAKNFGSKPNEANKMHRVENFFSDYANDKRVAGPDLTASQKTGLDALAVSVAATSQSIKSLFKPLKGDTVSKKGKAYNQRALSNDAMQYLADENGQFDENLLSTIGVVAANWLTSEAYNNVYNSSEDINKIIGQPADTPLLAGAMETLQKVGSVSNVIKESLGKEILAATGIRANKDAPGELQGNLALSLGQMAVASMLDQGILVEHTVPSDTIANFAGNEGKGDARVYTAFLRVATQLDVNEREIPAQHIDGLVEELRNSENVIDALFGIASKETGPVFDKPTNVVQNIKGNFQKVSKSVQKIIKAHQERPHAIKTDVTNVFSFLPEDMQRDMLGYKADIENTVHKYHKDNVIGLNNEIVRSIENHTNFVDKLMNQGSIETKFYMQHEVWKNQRLGMISNTINLQGDKLHRHLYGMDAWTTTVDPVAQPELLVQAKLAVAEGLGIGVDKLTIEASLAQFDELVSTPTIKNALKAIKAVNGKRAVNENKIDEYQDFILAAVKQGGEKAFTLDALVNLAKISSTTKFDFNLFREVDGITNGVAIGTWQLGAADSEADMNVRLTRTGLYNEADAATHGERAMNPNNKDSYNDLSEAWENEMNLLRQGKPDAQLTALDSMIFGENKATTITRAMSKNPLMITNYGAAIKGVVDAFAEKVIGDMYNNMASADAVTLKQLQAQIETVSGMKFVINPNEQLNTVMHPKQDTAIREYISQTYGMALENALEAKYKAFSTNRTHVNTAMTVMFEAFNIRYKRKLAALESELGHAASSDAKAQLTQDLMESVPAFNNYFSKLSGNANEKTLAMKTEKVRQYDDERYTARQSYAKPLKGTTNPNTKKAVTQTADSSSTEQWADAGVAPMILAIHGIDAATMVLQLEKNAGLNVHDAYAFQIDEAVSGTQNFNEGFHKVMSELSVAEEVLNEVTAAVKILVAEDKAEGTDNIKQLDAILKAKKQGSTADYIASATTDLKAIVAEKNKTTDSIKTVSQYHTEGGAFNVSEAADTTIEGSIEDIARSFNSSDDIDTSNFHANYSTDVNAQNSVQILQDLAFVGTVKTTAAHAKTLENVLDTMVNKVIRPMKLAMNDIAGGETHGVVKGRNIYINNSVGGVMNQVQMSAQEVYVHELVHSVTAAGIDSTTFAARELNKLFLQARAQLDHTAFMAPGDTDVVAAQKRFDHIFNNTDKHVTGGKKGLTDTTAVRTNHLHEFVAIGLTNANFIEALKGVDMKKTAKVNESLWETMDRIFHQILDFITGQITHTGRMKADAKLRALGTQLAGIDIAKKNHVFKAYEKWTSLKDKQIDANIKKLVVAIVKPVTKFVNQEVVQKSKNATVKKLGHIASVAANSTFDQWKNAQVLIGKNITKAKDGFIAQTITEIRGRTAVNTDMHRLARIGNKAIDQARLETQTQVAKQLLAQFKTELTREDKNSLTRALLKTDVESISNQYSLTEIAGLLESGKDLSNEIDKLNRQLTGTNRYFYRKQARNLGLMMATGRSKEHLTLRNSSNITNLFGTDGVVEGNLEETNGIIDTLATLHAMQYTSKSERDLAAKVIKAEHAAEPDANGITFMLKQHGFAKEQSREKNFAGSENLIVKGHTKELLDPNVSVKQVATVEERDALLDANWKIVTVLKQDKAHPEQGDVYLMVNKDGLQAKYDSGVTSLTSLSAQGSDLITVRGQRGGTVAEAQQDGQIIHAKKASKIAAMFGHSDTRTTDDNNMLVQIMNNDGDVTGYRYMMAESTKLNLMNKDDSFDQVLGGMQAAIDDKVNSELVNTEVVKQLYKDYAAGFKETPELFVKVGATSSDAELKEIYAMLPAAMRQDIKNVWGGKDMWVRRDMVTLVFGQRRFTLAGVLTKQAIEDEKGFKKIMLQFNNALVKLNPAVATVEDYWLETVAAVKDAIVIKTGVVTAANIGSNLILLKTLGVPMSDIVKNHGIAATAAIAYIKDKEQLANLEAEVEFQHGNTRGHSFKIAQLQNKISNSPVKELMDAGVYSAIVEDIGAVDKKFTKAGNLDKALEPIKANKVGGKVVKAAELVMLGHETKAYEILRNTAQLSDFVARFTLHEFNKANGMESQASIDMIVDTFIDYDLPTHKATQYLNDIGFVMFTKYFLRTQRVILHIMKNNPGATLMNLMIQSYFGDVSDIMDSNMLEANYSAKTNPDLLSLVPALFNIPTLNAIR